MVTKKQIVEHLEALGVKEKPDEILINELVFQIKLAQKLKEKVDTYLIKEYKSGAKANPAIDSYLKVTRSISNLCAKLGITVQDRTKLGLKNNEDGQLAIEQFLNFSQDAIDKE